MASTLRLPSERRFGFTLAALFALSGGYELLTHRESGTASALLLICGATLALITFIVPRVLGPLNRAWFLFGERLGRITSPIALGLLFFVVVTPIAVVARWCGRDELRLRRRADRSYWIEREPAPPPRDFFRNQF
jgi:Saxitoxin biosynthesis operon protein SxtJ